ncbi:ubiquitin conjugating [Apiospora marii]|uniref:ubiquitin conjugating n=1 Tax=Apiospora marii TaxID=335849 RepID=UPI00312FA754
MYKDVAAAVYKRAAVAYQDGDRPVHQLPGWSWPLMFIDFLIFIPLFVYVGYTMNNLYPVLAMIEDPAPPAYDPVSLNEDDQSVIDDSAPVADEAARASPQTIQITASFRNIHRTLIGIGGWRSNFRGFACWVALTVSTMFVYGIVSVLPILSHFKSIAALISAVALVQLYAAWLHIVISAPSDKHFWQRLPDFKQTFRACALPTAVYFVTLEIQQGFPKFLARVMGMSVWNPKRPGEVPQPQSSDIWKGLVVMIVMLILTIFLTIPAHVMLTRVQASLLPEHDETIVPFDRSFQGTLEPAIVGGRGFVSMKDAWNTFSRASWVRLVKLYLKIFGVSLALNLAFSLIVVPQAVFMIKASQPIRD